MKKTISILLMAVMLIFTNCVTTEKISPATSGEATNGDYELLANQRTTSETKQIFFCFIPIGGKDDETMKVQCYDKLLKDNAADGVFLPTYIITKTRYPFFGKTKIELQGRPYKLKQK